MHVTVNPSWALTSTHTSQWMAFAFALGLTGTRMGQILVKGSRKSPGGPLTVSPTWVLPPPRRHCGSKALWQSPSCSLGGIPLLVLSQLRCPLLLEGLLGLPTWNSLFLRVALGVCLGDGTVTTNFK